MKWKEKMGRGRKPRLITPSAMSIIMNSGDTKAKSDNCYYYKKWGEGESQG